MLTIAPRPLRSIQRLANTWQVSMTPRTLTREGPVPLVRGHVEKFAHRDDAVRIDKYVDGAGERFRTRHHFLHILQLRYIALHRPCLGGERKFRGDFGEARASMSAITTLAPSRCRSPRSHAAQASAPPVTSAARFSSRSGLGLR